MFRVIAALSLGLTLSSCATVRGWLHHTKTGVPEDRTKDLPVQVGTVESVNPDAKFVLVRLLANMAVTPDTILTVTGTDNRIAKLKVTPERKGIFITADIVEGEPVKGDPVSFIAPNKPAATDQPAITSTEPALPGVPPDALPTISIRPGEAAQETLPLPVQSPVTQP